MAYIGRQPGGGLIFGSSGAGTIAGTINGSNRDFTLPASVDNAQQVLLFVDGLQQSTDKFTITGAPSATLNFNSGNAPPTDSEVACVIIQDSFSLATVNDDTITAAKLDAALISGHTNIGATPAGADELLLSDAGVLKAVTVTNLMAAGGGGITAASQWRVTADFTGASSGAAAGQIDANWEEVDAPVGFGVLGSSMTESSGVFTFPSTGYWWIQAHGEFYYDGATQYSYFLIKTTHDDGSWAVATNPGQGSSTAASDFFQCDSSYIFDVTSTSTHKVAFKVGVGNASATTKGDSTYNETHVTFIRLGDT